MKRAKQIQGWLRGRWFLAWAALVLSALAIFATTVVYSLSSRATFRADQALSTLRLARLDFAEGCLLVMAEGNSITDRAEGLAQLTQSGEAFGEAGRSLPAPLPGASAPATAAGKIRKEVEDLVRRLSAPSGFAPSGFAPGAAGARPAARDPIVKISFRAVDRMAEALDLEIQSKLGAFTRTLQAAYLLGIWSVSLVLIGMATAAYQGARAELRVDRELRESRSLLRAIIDRTPSMIYAYDRQGRCIITNRTHAGAFGRGEEEILGKSRREWMTAEESLRHEAQDQRCFLSGATEEFEESLSAEGRTRWYLTSKFPLLDDRGEVFAVAGISTDVTERRDAAEGLRKAYAEKSALLDEINHRARNNMQVISSWLALQSMRTTDPAVRESLRQADARIAAIALVHSTLYRGGDLSYLDLGAYLGDLLILLFRQFEVDRSRVSLKLDIESLRTIYDAALPCGLILSEFFANSLKHAFGDGRRGQVSLALRRNEDQRIWIKYRDDGPGLPEGFVLARTQGMGLASAVASVEGQLRGRIAFGNGGGFSCVIEFDDSSFSSRV